LIALHGFGPAFGLPDASPFVTKAEVLLKMAGLPYLFEAGNLSKAPKRKLPYIVDDGETIADSTFIRWHLERKYKIDFDRGLSAEQRAVAWAFEKMLEEHLYWPLVQVRWMNDANFAKGPKQFFSSIPSPVRPLVTAMVRRQLRRTLYGQGTGRHSPAEIAALGARSIEATADYLGRKSFMMGAEPTGLDATAFAFVASALCPIFETELRSAAERHENLRRYVGRMTARFYPDLSEIAGCKAVA
jgi:glutathione S-transferase